MAFNRSGVLSRIDELDDWLDRALDFSRGRRGVDRFFYTLTESANHSLLWHAVNLTQAAAHWPRGNDRAKRLALTIALESALINGVVKRWFRRSRPHQGLPHPHRLRAPKTTSFPSGHATSAFCAATLLSEGKRPVVKAGWYCLASLVSYSRIHVRLHHVSDVLGGVAIGIGLGRLARKIFVTQRGSASTTISDEQR